MRQILRSLLGCLTVTLLLLASPAHAQRAAADKAAAEALFDEALELMQQKRYAEACPKLEQSQRVDAGIGTLLYLGECYEKLGRTASAWATFREASSAASAAGQADRARQGRERADRLEDKLSKLTILVAPENKALDGFQVSRGDQRVQPPLFDTAIPVDPGQVTIEARAPGYLTLSRTVNVPPDSGRALVEIPPLTADPQATADTAPPGAEPGLGASGAEPSGMTGGQQGEAGLAMDTGGDANRGKRTAGVVLMGVGAAGLVVGSIFGVQAIRKNNEAEDLCNDRSVCLPEAETPTEDANRAATISTIAFIAGGLAGFGGILLYATSTEAPSATRVEVNPIAGGAALSYSGRF